MNSLILLVTHRCNQGCSYCPVVGHNAANLTPERAVQALELFVDAFGGGRVKIFGGEPLLVPEVVEAVLEATVERPALRRVDLYTNGIALDARWIKRLAGHPRCGLLLSLDGAPEDHRRHRRSTPGAPDAYDHLLTLLPELLSLRRLVVTQVVPPATAHRAAANFRHLLSLGFEAIRILPASWVRWQRGELVALRAEFAEIARTIADRWTRGEAFRLANRYERLAQPAFAVGLVVDGDGRLYPSDCVVGDMPEGLRTELCVGTLGNPPTPEVLRRSAEGVSDVLRRWRPDDVWRSTLAADAELTRFCRAVAGIERAYRDSRPMGWSSSSPKCEA